MRLIPGFLIWMCLVAATLSAEDKTKEISKKIDEATPQEENLQTADARHKSLHLPLDDEYDDHGEGSLEVSSDSFRGDKHLKGNQNHGDVDELHSTDMHHERGANQDFNQGGSNYNKHHKENVADNKELENVKQHDAGEKFGAEALKEHKLGKHKEKSKGHKLHGFKNTYHKEEYGDHKTFHDEFLDTDHHHNYDDHHEHRQLQGGKFSKGFKQEGKNKNLDDVEESNAWGKEGHDSFEDGKHERGGHGSSHHHGHKKHEGHHEASAHEGRQSSKKQKKGEAPHYYSDKPHKAHYDNYHPENDQPGPYSYHGQENYQSYPPVESNHYSNEHGSYSDHEERSAPLGKNVLIEEPNYADKKPITVKSQKRAPLEHLSREPLDFLNREPEDRSPLGHSNKAHKNHFNLAPVDYQYRAPVKQHYREPVEHQYREPVKHQYRETVDHQYPEPVEHINRKPVEHLHRAIMYKELPSEISMPPRHNVKQKHESTPYHKPSSQNVKQQPVGRHYSQPVSVQYTQFYHKGPQQQFQAQPKPRENIYHGHISSHHNDHEPNIKPQEHAQQIRGYSHLNSHPHSQPYDWRERGAASQKYQANEPRAPSRFDVGEPKVVDNYQKTHYIPTESHQHYIYH